MSQYVEFPLGGQTRQFRLTCQALEGLESDLGLATWTDLLDKDRAVSAALTNAVLWRGLLWKEQVTKGQVMAWIDDANLRECMLFAVTLLFKAAETFAEAPASDPLAPPAGTGEPPSGPRSGSA